MLTRALLDSPSPPLPLPPRLRLGVIEDAPEVVSPTLAVAILQPAPPADWPLHPNQIRGLSAPRNVASVGVAAGSSAGAGLAAHRLQPPGPDACRVGATGAATWPCRAGPGRPPWGQDGCQDGPPPPPLGPPPAGGRPPDIASKAFGRGGPPRYPLPGAARLTRAAGAGAAGAVEVSGPPAARLPVTGVHRGVKIGYARLFVREE